MSVNFDKLRLMSVSRYLAMRQDLEEGCYDRVSRNLRDLRSSSDPVDLILHALIGFRLAVKTTGDAQGFLSQLQPEKATDLFLKAETFFARGLVRFHLNDYAEGKLDFSNARKIYEHPKVGDAKRALLAAYNAYCGAVNNGEINDPNERFAAIKGVLCLAQAQSDSRILGLILRDRSELYQENDKFLAARADAQRALELLEDHGPKSDFNLALLQLADCELDLGNRDVAELCLDRMISPLDQRVVCLESLVRARLKGEFPPSQESREWSIWPGLRWKLQRAAVNSAQPALAKGIVLRARWRQPESKLVLDSGKIISLKANSLEGKLLAQLHKAPSSKDQLIEALWPSQSAVQHLDNRFFQLLHRFNQKTSDLAHFDGSRYRLGREVELT